MNRLWIFIWCILNIIWVVCCARQNVSFNTFKAGGSSFAQTLFNPWFFAYRAVQRSFRLSFFSTSENSVSTGILDNQLDFGVVTVPLSLSLINSVLTPIPIAYGGVAITFNIPSLPFDLQYAAFLLDPQLVIDIWLGVVNNWRDPRILSLNPAFDPYLPDTSIILVLPVDPSPFTSLFGHMFTRISPTWDALYGNTTEITGQWPVSILNRNTTYPATSYIFLDGSLPNVANSISYLPISVAAAKGLPMFQIVNKASFPIISTQISDMYQMFENDPSLLSPTFVDITNYNHPKAYPFAAMLYLLLPPTESSNCTRTRELWKFFHWTLFSDASQDTAQDSGFGGFGTANATVIEMLANFTCNGLSLLHLDVVPQRVGSSYIAILVIALILFALVVVAAICYFRFVVIKDPGRRVELLYICILLAACALNYTSVIAWYTIPSNDSICIIRQWFTALGFTIMLGGLFSRTWHLHKIYQLMHKNSKLLIKIRAVFDIIIIMSIVITLQIALLLIWTTIRPMRATLTVVDPINLSAEWSCVGENVSEFLIVEFVFLLAAVLWGIWVLYRTWSFKDKASETRWLLIAIYNIILTVCVIGPLIIALPSTDDNVFFIAGIGIILATSGAVFVIYLPKVLAQLKLHSSSSKSPQTPGTGGSEVHQQSGSRLSDSRKHNLSTVSESETKTRDKTSTASTVQNGSEQTTTENEKQSNEPKESKGQSKKKTSRKTQEKEIKDESDKTSVTTEKTAAN